MQSLPVLHFTANAWVLENKHVSECTKDASASKLQYLLLDEDVFSSGKQLAPELSQRYQIPEYMLSNVYRHSNGFFKFEEDVDKQGHLKSCRAWLRILVKAVSSQEKPGYKWQEMTFCSRWEPANCSILCIGVNTSFQTLFREILPRVWPELPSSNPYSLHIPIIETIIAMHDSSVWSLRNIVRDVEKGRTHLTQAPHDLLRQHETMRHAIHSSEILNIAVETLGVLKECVARLSSGGGQASIEPSESPFRIQVHIECQIRMLRNLFLRSQSNKERLQNEISLSYNMIAQRDSQTMAGLGLAAKVDSGAMRTIAVVTMAFLPPTFLSAIFSMSFFNYTPSQGDESGGWSVSDKFWIYWAFAVPLTCMTLATWFWRQKRHVSLDPTKVVY
ncbi:hypothetical protein BKA66DRAFT_464397 [Pyrenochaeta sp. MPI-SDFR-AT-0127]|nr:hypothetical protein BKA66DRAFT_464397 [Pyrenochaeta sp. MPI-SDFR-AT-0127]